MDSSPTGSHGYQPTDELSLSAADSDEPPEGIRAPILPVITIDYGSRVTSPEVRDGPCETSWPIKDAFLNLAVMLPLMRSSFQRKSEAHFPRRPETSHGGSHTAEVTFVRQLYSMLFTSWINVLLVFVPMGAISYIAKMNPLLVFTCNAIAIVPLSALLTEATERIAATAGDTIGALLNISFGNLVELILLIALANNQVRIVQASILGSILVNLLLILGSALVGSSMANLEPVYNTVEAQLLACLLFVSVFVILMPTTFAQTLKIPEHSQGVVLKMSRISSLMILVIYIIYFVHEIRSRQSDDAPVTKADEVDIEVGQTSQHTEPESSFNTFSHLQTPSNSQTLPPRTIRFADEGERDNTRLHSAYKSGRDDVEMAESVDAESEYDYRGRRRGDGPGGSTLPSPYQPLLWRRHSRSMSLGSSRGYHSRDSSLSGRRSVTSAFHILRDNRADMDQLVHRHSDVDGSAAEKAASIAMLILSSAVMSVCAEFLVSTIDEVTHEGGLSESLIGLIILPIVGNVAEYATVMAVALKDKMDLAIAVSVGSAIQIALCVTPLTVLAGWVLQKDMSITFNSFEMATLLGSVLMANLLILTEGGSSLRTGGLKGALMCLCYAIIGLGAWLEPAYSS